MIHVCRSLAHVPKSGYMFPVLKRLIKITKVPNIRFHDIRHTHASILISEGVDSVKILKWLGHANPK